MKKPSYFFYHEEEEVKQKFWFFHFFFAGSKFNFQFWTGKAKDTFKNATTLGNNNTKKTTTTIQSPNGYEHAITTPSTYEQQERDRKVCLYFFQTTNK